MNLGIRRHLQPSDIPRRDLMDAVNQLGIKLPRRQEERDAIPIGTLKFYLTQHYETRNAQNFLREAKLRTQKEGYYALKSSV